MTKYKDLFAGAKGLLGECVRILSGTNEEYIIIGGWSPYLLNSAPIKHPGTHDVDLLFKEGRKEGELREIMQRFLSEGFITSAKHNFQLLKVINVGGQDFVYNVDFLHASDNNGKEDMFVDHLKLPVLLSEYRDETYMEMSIKASNSDVLFNERLFELHSEKFILPDGTTAEIEFPLMNEQGLIITKTDSVNQAKRRRDSFDIFLSTKQARNYEKLTSWFRDLKYRNADLFNSLFGIRNAIDKNGMIANILHYAYPSAEQGAHLKEVTSCVEKFLADVGLEVLAKAIYLKDEVVAI
jgi:hypothetical protein